MITKQAPAPATSFREHWEAAAADDWEARGASREARLRAVAWQDAWVGLMAQAVAWADLDAERSADLPAIQDVEASLQRLQGRTTSEVVQLVTDWWDAPATGWVPTVDDLERGQEAQGNVARVDMLLREVVTEYSDVVDCTMEEGGNLVQDDAPWHLWVDLRPSEATRLRAIMDDARERAERDARRAIMEALAEGARTFAREYPDARRPEPAPAS